MRYAWVRMPAPENAWSTFVTCGTVIPFAIRGSTSSLATSIPPVTAIIPAAASRRQRSGVKPGS